MYRDVNEIIKDLETNPIEKGGHTYHPIPFSEFSHLKTSSNVEEVYRKWTEIKKICIAIYPAGFYNLKVMDIGANAGFFTFSMAKAGAHVVAFEPNVRYSQIGSFLLKEKKLNVEWCNAGFDEMKVCCQQFDLTLMLSVFQWICQGGVNMENAAKNLTAISKMSRYLIFELGFNHGKSAIITKKINHYAFLISLLKLHTNYLYFKLLKITRLWKSCPRYLVLCSNDRRFEDHFGRRILRRINW